MFGAFVSYFIFERTFISVLIAVIAGGGIFYLIGTIYEWVAKQPGLGLGDVYLMAFFGAYLGIKSLPFIILISSLSGTITGLYLMIVKGKDSKYALPFGPFLSFAALLYLFLGEKIINWYFDLLIR